MSETASSHASEAVLVASREARRNLLRQVERSLACLAETGAELGDCPECGTRGSVASRFCDICNAKVHGVRAVDLPPAALPRRPLTFLDVVAEIQVICDAAKRARSIPSVEIASGRAEQLLLALRQQFVTDLVGRRP